MDIDSLATAPMWAGFIAFVLAMLALDLFVFGGNKAHRVSVREAGAWVTAWVLLAFAFAGLLLVVPRYATADREIGPQHRAGVHHRVT